LASNFTDNTLQPSTTYDYQIAAVDFHGNYAWSNHFTVTTPPAQAVDPRRVGVLTTGNYWGGGGEQIDTLSGNLNFTLPLLTAQGRAGWKIPVGLSYNAQNWRQDNGANWQLGSDVGFGFGWRMTIGSITPYYIYWWDGPDHYVFTDSTGAEYRLDVNNGGVWSSTHGVYVWFDSNANVLHFKDGTFWVMGCTSGGTEPDAGTEYPTIIEDVSGNQVIVTYDTAAGLPYLEINGLVYTSTPNTSSRIADIEDVRAQTCGSTGCQEITTTATYVFRYDRTHFATPHLSSLTNKIGTSESYTFTYASASVNPPFGADSTYAGATTYHLASTLLTGGTFLTFSYDTAGASELTQVTYPQGGHLRWVYATDPYNGNRALRAVTNRYVAADSAGALEWNYTFTRDNASSATIHQTATLVDASGVGAKTWNFLNPSSGSLAWQIGLVSGFIQTASSGGTVYTNDTYTWSQDPAGNPYISQKVSVTDPGTPNQQSAKTTQTLDPYGNVTQSVIYPYNNTTTPLRTYNNTFLNTGTYPSHYILNRLLTTTLTTGGATKTLVTNTYDGPPTSGVDHTCGAFCAPPTELDPNPPIPATQRGYLATSVTPARATSYAYMYGALTNVGASDGSTMAASPSSVTNYAAPDSITTQSYGQSYTYNAWLGITQTTGLNGEQLSMTYDYTGRPSSAHSPYGATWTYAYSDSPLPAWQSKSGPDGFTRTTLDGLGRAIRVERGPASNQIQSVVDTVYAPCACSPLGKVQKVSAPYPSGQSATNWTVYSYDGIGRTLSVTQPDGASATTYAYAGNQTSRTRPISRAER
jgi:YD repeat-containing protein